MKAISITDLGQEAKEQEGMFWAGRTQEPDPEPALWGHPVGLGVHRTGAPRVCRSWGEAVVPGQLGAERAARAGGSGPGTHWCCASPSAGGPILGPILGPPLGPPLGPTLFSATSSGGGLTACWVRRHSQTEKRSTERGIVSQDKGRIKTQRGDNNGSGVSKEKTAGLLEQDLQHGPTEKARSPEQQQQRACVTGRDDGQPGCSGDAIGSTR